MIVGGAVAVDVCSFFCIAAIAAAIIWETWSGVTYTEARGGGARGARGVFAVAPVEQELLSVEQAQAGLLSEPRSELAERPTELEARPTEPAELLTDLPEPVAVLCASRFLGLVITTSESLPDSLLLLLLLAALACLVRLARNVSFSLCPDRCLGAWG
jgi:hypothetical protein